MEGGTRGTVGLDLLNDVHTFQLLRAKRESGNGNNW